MDSYDNELVARGRRRSHPVSHSPYSSPRERKKSFSSHRSPPLPCDTFQPYNATSVVSCVPVKPVLLERATDGLLDVFRKADPAFSYMADANPRRVLTKPSKPKHNNNFDNQDYDYILYVNDILGDQEGRKYKILDLLGQGTFGQVVKCINLKTQEQVAVKVIKNKPAYYNQSKIEVTLLELLNRKFDVTDTHHIVRMKDSFMFRNHLCIVFEMLSVNLYELIKQNSFKGLSLNLVRVFISQILDALCVLSQARVIHCDLKPENILLKSFDAPDIKVIDFGSACFDSQTVYTYIQSRFYRSPEVLLGLPYSTSIDLWSLGCIAAELFLGLPLFPGTSEYNQVSRIVEMLGVPPLSVCERGKTTRNFFKRIKYPDGHVCYQLKTIEEYAMEFNVQEQPSKKYFKGTTLEEVIMKYPISSKKSQQEVDKEMALRYTFIDFLKGILTLDPAVRWTPEQIAQHPFLQGKPLAPETSASPYNSIPSIPACPPPSTIGSSSTAHLLDTLPEHQSYHQKPPSQQHEFSSYLTPSYIQSGGLNFPPADSQSAQYHSYSALSSPSTYMSNASGYPSAAMNPGYPTHAGYQQQGYAGSGTSMYVPPAPHSSTMSLSSHPNNMEHLQQMVGNFADFNLQRHPSMDERTFSHFTQSQPAFGHNASGYTSAPNPSVYTSSHGHSVPYPWTPVMASNEAMQRRISIPNREGFGHFIDSQARRNAPTKQDLLRNKLMPIQTHFEQPSEPSIKSSLPLSNHDESQNPTSAKGRNPGFVHWLRQSAAMRRVSAPDIHPRHPMDSQASFPDIPLSSHPSMHTLHPHTPTSRKNSFHLAQPMLSPQNSMARFHFDSMPNLPTHAENPHSPQVSPQTSRAHPHPYPPAKPNLHPLSKMVDMDEFTYSPALTTGASTNGEIYHDVEGS